MPQQFTTFIFNLDITGNNTLMIPTCFHIILSLCSGYIPQNDNFIILLYTNILHQPSGLRLISRYYPKQSCLPSAYTKANLLFLNSIIYVASRNADYADVYAHKNRLYGESSICVLHS